MFKLLPTKLENNPKYQPPYLTPDDKKAIEFLLENKEKLNPDEYYKVKKNGRKKYNLIKTDSNVYQVTIYQKSSPNDFFKFDYHIYNIAV